MMYEWKGFPYPEKGWRYSRETMARLDSEGRIWYPKRKDGSLDLTKRPQFKRYLDEQSGGVMGNVWTDISPVNSQAQERLGYPTQKPTPLLERIIQASSNENDIVLDAFCGCGTALVAAEKLKRQWIGIDISPTACRVVAKRLRKDCGLRESEELWAASKGGFIVRDLPRSEAELRKIPPFEFENWAVIALGGIPNKAKVGDMGIDGRIFPVSAMPERRRGMADPGFDFLDIWYPIQVKQQDKVGRPDIDKFEAAMIREERTKGFFVSFDYTSDAMTEIGRFFKQTGKVIVPFTVGEILNEQIAQKLA
jgi:site-specific DNA-methyltransferase (adenine-specific)